jgi:ABC-type nitrate/sulfonate/bicarbonate transport system substrate-binding protein
MRNRTKRTRVLIACALASVVAIVGGCGSGSASGTSSSDATTTLSLTLVEPGQSLDFGTIYAAIGSGNFKKEHLNVKLISAGQTATDYVVSGQADVIVFNMGTVMTLVSNGKPMKVIGSVLEQYPSALLGVPSIDSVKAANSLPSTCRLATVTPGTEQYYFAAVYKKDLHLNCTIATVGNDNIITAGVESGAYQLATLPYGNAETLAAANKAHILIDPSKPKSIDPYMPKATPEVVLFGLPSHLAKIRPAIVRLMKAIQLTQSELAKQPLATSAQDILNSDELPGTSMSVMEQELKAERPFMVSNLPDGPYGYISSKVWPTTLQQLGQWGLQGFNPSAAKYSYNSIVDMSYFNAAAGN